MVFSPLYLVVMNWVFPFEILFLSDWILLWIWEHLIHVLHMNNCGDNGVSYWFTWYVFWHSTRGFPRWHWGNLCIGVDARSRLCFSGRNLGALFEVPCVGLNIMNLKLFDVILVRTLDRSIGKNSFEVVSYPTNDFFLCSPLDRNFGVILRCTLRDGYMIQLY